MVKTHNMELGYYSKKGKKKTRNHSLPTNEKELGKFSDDLGKRHLKTADNIANTWVKLAEQKHKKK